MDPTWKGFNPPVCEGAIEWEPGTGWWICTECGYVGKSQSQIHYPVQPPFYFLLDSIWFYFYKRSEQGMSFWASLKQLMFTTGIAIRYSAVVPPENLDEYVKKMWCM